MNMRGLDDRLHVAVRGQAQTFKEMGMTPDKKLLRWNDCVEACKRYAQCGSIFREEIALAAVSEVVESCFKESALYSKDGPLRLVPDWMIVEG